ncbi:MAG: phosphomannose isomerase type II C-terminal cupin domain [Actinomycetota bacterium]
MSDITKPSALIPADPRERIETVNRPWGSFRQFAFNELVTVKTITVKPGLRLSLQRHASRAEFWHILDVPLEVTVGERTWTAKVGEDVWIPLGEIHRLGNPGNITGRVLEIAFGDFDENDIERLEDDFDRRE